MKKLFASTLLLATCLPSFAQLTYWNSEFRNDHLREKHSQRIADNGIQSRKEFVQDYDKNDWEVEKRLTKETRYASNGFVTESITYHKKGHIERRQAYTYDKNNQIASFILYKGDKIVHKWTGKYNEDNNPTEKVYYKKGGEEILTRWEYSYYENGQKKETKRYDGKGKLKHSWSYACNPQGQEIKKNTSEICLKEDYDESGNKIKVIRNTDEKNRMVKSVFRYDKNDRVKEVTNYNFKEKMVNRWNYSYDTEGHIIEFSSFVKGGKHLGSWTVFEYNEKGHQIGTQRVVGKKLSALTKVKHNDQGFMTSKVSYEAPEVPSKRYLVEYDIKK